MTFWLAATGLTVLTALFLFRPLLRRESGLPGLGLALLALVPVTAMMLYQGVGTPAALDMPQQIEDAGEADMSALVDQLAARMEAAPDDLEGWLLLGRSYRSLQRYAEALAAFERARAMAPGDPVVAVELAEALIFNSGPEGLDPDVPSLLEEALQQAPDLQKGLWLSGMVAAQGGDDAAAVRHWGQLLPLLEPGSSVAASVQTQLDAARARLGDTSAPAWAGIEVVVQAPENLPPLGPQAALFVIVRDPSSPGPPLGAARLPTAFPATVRLTDADAMMPGRPISGATELQLLARLSPDGNPVGGVGSLESEAMVVGLDRVAPVELVLSSGSADE